jgi:hypothetical protein
MGAKQRPREAAAAMPPFLTPFESSAARATKDPQAKKEKARADDRAFHCIGNLRELTPWGDGQ